MAHRVHPVAKLGYGWNGYYIITICTANRECFFGNICNDIMNLSETGQMAEQFWNEIPNHFPFVVLDAFVIMPNHLHGILIIARNSDGNPGFTITSFATMNHMKESGNIF